MQMRCVVVIAAVLAAGGVARADAARDAQAKDHYEAGTAAFNLGEWLRAVDEYKKAYTAKPEPVLLYDIAQSYRLANDLPNAVFFYRSYLRNQPNAPNHREIDERIRKLEQQIHQQQQVASQPPNTPVPLGAQPSREPAHAVTTPPPAPPPVATTPTPAPEPATTTPAPAPAPEASAEPAPSSSPALQLTQSSSAPKERTPVYKKWWLWTIVGGVVVVGVGVGLGIGLSGSSAPSTHLGTTGVF
jgi:tetratricopeptide (TPR) repeat protein